MLIKSFVFSAIRIKSRFKTEYDGNNKQTNKELGRKILADIFAFIVRICYICRHKRRFNQHILTSKKQLIYWHYANALTGQNFSE